MAQPVTLRPKKKAELPSFPYLELFRAEPFERIVFIKTGVSARQFKFFITEFDFDQHVMLDALNLKTATVNRKAAKNDVLSTEESERVVGLAKLVGQLKSMLQDSSDDPDFDATGWLSRWLREPLPAMNGAMPIEFLDTIEGQGLVSRVLAQVQSGAYA